MSRLSFRPRPLDIHKKLPIVKSVKELEDDETPTSTRNSQLIRSAVEVDNEVHQVPCKKLAPDIPTPQFVVVDTYEIDYSRTFSQPTSYLRGRGARTELGEFVEYDLDNEDEDWLLDLNRERKILTPERFESFLFKLEVLDHKARERAGIITTTLGSPVPVLLQHDNAIEALQTQAIRYSVIESVYNYWKEKREQWQKPILRRLQIFRNVVSLYYLSWVEVSLDKLKSGMLEMQQLMGYKARQLKGKKARMEDSEELIFKKMQDTGHISIEMKNA